MSVSTKVLLPHRIEDFFFGAYMRHFARMPLDRASAAGANWLLRLGPLTSAHTTCLRNLRLAFPAESERWRIDVARAAWACLGRTAGEFPHLKEICLDGVRLQLEGNAHFEAIRDGRIPTVFISGHFANWEIMASVIAQSGVPCHVTYRPANNPLIDARIVDTRRQYGLSMQAAKGVEGGMGLMRALAKKQSVAVMNDQKYNEGVQTTFFGHKCMTADGPTRLARRFGALLQPLSVVRAEARFTAAAHEPIDIEPSEPDETAIPRIVQRITDFVEQRVRAAPDQWFWVHRRWPRSAWVDAGAL